MAVFDWLLDADPAIRWQALRDLGDAPAEQVAAERARVANEGWGARLLALRGDDGLWEGGALFPAGTFDRTEGQPWIATEPTLTLLLAFGVDPGNERVRQAVAQVREHCRWEHAGQRFFDGEVEPCINGRTVALGVYVGQGQDVGGIVARLLNEQLDDGGWNCEAENGSVRSSFDTTINVLEGLLAYERACGQSTERVEAARRRAEEYLLQRKLFRRKSTGEIVNPAWLQFSFPPRWHYDVLRALDYFRAVGGPPDPRLAEAIEVLRSKGQPDGTWLLENTHRGKVHFALEDGDGQPSRWNTLRALRVLRWYDATRPASTSAVSS